MTASPDMIDVFHFTQFTHKLCVVYNALSVISLLGAPFLLLQIESHEVNMVDQVATSV